MSSDNAISDPRVFGTENITTRHSHVGRKGDLVIELHYGEFDTGHKRQAALYIWRKGHEKDGIFIPLSHMWMYAEKDAFHTMIPPLAKHLYSFVTQMDQVRVLDAILDFIQDLRMSPPDPHLFRDTSLDAFLQGCEDEGLEFFVDVNGKRVVN